MATEALADAGCNLDGQCPRRDAGRDDIFIVRALRDELAVFHDFLLNDGNQSIAAAKTDGTDAQHTHAQSHDIRVTVQHALIQSIGLHKDMFHCHHLTNHPHKRKEVLRRAHCALALEPPFFLVSSLQTMYSS